MARLSIKSTNYDAAASAGRKALTNAPVQNCWCPGWFTLLAQAVSGAPFQIIGASSDPKTSHMKNGIGVVGHQLFASTLSARFGKNVKTWHLGSLALL